MYVEILKEITEKINNNEAIVACVHKINGYKCLVFRDEIFNCIGRALTTEEIKRLFIGLASTIKNQHPIGIEIFAHKATLVFLRKGFK